VEVFDGSRALAGENHSLRVGVSTQSPVLNAEDKWHNRPE
jgi:hypothetical protein